MNGTSVLTLLALAWIATSCRCPGSPGDLIAFTRLKGFYHHYAINVGNGYIVHLSGSSTNELQKCFEASFLRSGRCEIAKVKKEKCADVVKPGSKHIENKPWKGKKPLPANEIVERALSKVGTSGYNLLYKNCEHFARWCRYGEEDSKQAENLMLGLYMLRVTFFASFLLLFLVSLPMLYVAFRWFLVHTSIPLVMALLSLAFYALLWAFCEAMVEALRLLTRGTHFKELERNKPALLHKVQLTVVAWLFPPGTIFGDTLIIHEKEEKNVLIEYDLLFTTGK
ncbi:phospholipase A and acyltransferase 1-like [Actinia tenebrosa]|uniref:Phospholipase A and acyltransferase 1-like n=1 Tax=Actinia tenebrosa TaxID=6105 RepID=A0A6P8IYF8_ACTTE|nr:phospholipase A and acyltransferase 1-like [Actinia tenebrosa]